MRVCVSVYGRFHAFYLAQQLFKRNFLNQLITSYPKFEVSKYGLPKSLVSSVLSNELIFRGWDRLPCRVKRWWNLQFLLNERYDRLAASRIRQGANIFIGWSGSSLKSIRKARSLGMITILERGSCHIMYQYRMLKEEFSRYGLKMDIMHPGIIEKELQEYIEADYIEVPSSLARRTFIEQGIASDKIILGSRGVDLCRFKPAEKKDDIFRIIHCGVLTLEKGVHYLLQAFHELNLPKSELWIIGRLDDQMKPFIKKYLSANVSLLGTFPGAKLAQLYSQGSLFCLVSVQEGMANTILQAMSCGLPVICTENTGAGDVIRNNIEGFVIPIRDVSALKEKIVFMYENKEKCAQMGQAARRRVEADFTWDAYGNKIIAEYNLLLGN